MFVRVISVIIDNKDYGLKCLTQPYLVGSLLVEIIQI